MSDADAMTDPDASRFAGLAELRREHLTMLTRQSTPDGRSVMIPTAEIREFLRRAQATGAVIPDPEERGIAQRFLDYWCAELVASGREETAEAETVTLDPPETAQPAAAAAPDAPVRTGEEARQYIRLSALARQWRDSNGAAGYLVTGAALENARLFESDPEIARLIRASDQAARRNRNRLTAVLGVICLVLSGLLVLAAVQWNNARKERDVAEALSKDYLELAEQAGNARDEANAKAALASVQQKAAEERLTELQARQRLLDSAVSVLAGLTASGAVSLDELPPELRDEMRASAQRSNGYPVYSGKSVLGNLQSVPPDWAASIEPAPPDMTAAANAEPLVAALEGPFVEFRDDWLGGDPAASLRPGLDAPMRETALAGGELVPYLNYAVVLDRTQRQAIYVAANLDRTLRNVLPAGSAPLGTDPRLEGAEPDPAWYFTGDTLPGPLVQRDDIAWGPDGADALRVDAMVNALANTVPVTQTMLSAWDGVSDWLRAQHNPNALRVVLLGGPVLAGDAAPGSHPDALWKIAVSAQESYYGKGAVQLVADAFLVGQDAQDTDDPEQFRTTIAEIAARSGLVFSPELLAADRGPAVMRARDLDDALAAVLAGLDDADAPHAALAQDLQATLNQNGQDPTGQGTVAVALVGQLQDIGSLPAAGQASLVSLLASVPASLWDQPDWRGVKADARRSVADLNVQIASNAMTIDAELDRLRDALGLSARMPQTVYLQFDQLTDGTAGQLRGSLGALGWTLPAAERVETAAGLKQVRYNPGNPADEAAAQALAADIEALGWPDTRAIPVRIIKSGILEIWVGKP